MIAYKCKGLTLNYGKKKNREEYAIKNVNIELNAKGLYGVIGASGSGKSSFLYSIAGFKNEYLSGDVLYFDNNILEMKQKDILELRKKEFGFVFQKHFLIPYLNVMDNILSSVNDYRLEEKANEYLKLLGLYGLRNKQIYELSGGECQRVAIIRALIKSPKVLFADEPTAALDTEMTHKVFQLFKEYSQEHLVLVVSHDRGVFNYFDYKIELSNGEKVEG